MHHTKAGDNNGRVWLLVGLLKKAWILQWWCATAPHMEPATHCRAGRDAGAAGSSCWHEPALNLGPIQAIPAP